MQVYSLTTAHESDIEDVYAGPDYDDIRNLMLGTPQLFANLEGAKAAAQDDVGERLEYEGGGANPPVEWIETPNGEYGQWKGRIEGTDMLFVICRVEVR